MKALVVCQWPKLNRIINLCLGRSLGHGLATVAQVPIPRPTDTQLVVEVQAVALNPTDFKHVDIIAPAGAIIGCDYAGVVNKVSKNNPRNFKVGDRVAGVVHGGLYPDRGSFAQFVVVESDLTYRIPDTVTNREAAALGVSAVTAMQALNHNLDVPWPDKPSEESPTSTPAPTILIYAGSTSAGLLALQVARLGGYQAITTCSPHSFELVKKYGACAAFDYTSPTALEDIKKTYPDLSVAMDCFSQGESTSFCCKAMGSKGGKVITLLNSGPSKVPGVETKMILAYTLVGEPFQWWAPVGPKFAASPSDRAALVRFFGLLPSIIGERLRAPPIQILEGGFDGLLDGLDLLRQKKVSGKKLVMEFV
jgi:NADPH:quinone reductase-like Zn-dependent oxidoreductase